MVGFCGSDSWFDEHMTTEFEGHEIQREKFAEGTNAYMNIANRIKRDKV